jgi:menaquinone-9 beta-reductase
MTSGNANSRAYDVVIVGGGPAGSTTAISCRRADPSLRVLLLDRKVFPRDKSCGDGFGPGVSRLLAQMGLLHILDDAPAPTDVVVSGPDGTMAALRGPTVRTRTFTGHVLPRLIFDARLLDIARSDPDIAAGVG